MTWTLGMRRNVLIQPHHPLFHDVNTFPLSAIFSHLPVNYKSFTGKGGESTYPVFKLLGSANIDSNGEKIKHVVPVGSGGGLHICIHCYFALLNSLRARRCLGVLGTPSGCLWYRALQAGSCLRKTENTVRLSLLYKELAAGQND